MFFHYSDDLVRPSSIVGSVGCRTACAHCVRHFYIPDAVSGRQYHALRYYAAATMVGAIFLYRDEPWARINVDEAASDYGIPCKCIMPYLLLPSSQIFRQSIEVYTIKDTC